MGLKYWDKFEKIALKLAKSQKKDTAELTRLGDILTKEYLQDGYLRKMPLEAMSIDDFTFIPLLKYLRNQQPHPDTIVSPVRNQPNSDWMADSSLCFLNIRGLGKQPDLTGNFIDAAKLLPTLRVSGIHLAPFFECALEIVYGVDSLEVINEAVVHPYYAQNGMSAEEQARFFMDVVHLLGKTVGFDLEPHTSQFSRTAIENPQYFRWLKLSTNRQGLAKGLTQQEMLKENHQAEIRTEVTAIKNRILHKHGLKNLEQKGKDKTTKKAHYELIDELIQAGLWTLPSHTWKGAGLPDFSHYENDEDCDCSYPEFSYLCTEGKNHREHAFGTLTPFRFYDNLPMNKIPKPSDPPVANDAAIRFFTGIFPKLQKKYGFDFVRFDYVDHVFDSILDKSGKVPISDRMTPYALKKTLIRARSGGKKYIGAMAERMGTDIRQYAKVGFDLVLGIDVLCPIGIPLIKDTIKLNRKLEQINKNGKRKLNVQFAIDSHDTGHPLFKATPMLLYGKYGVALRQFIARFGGAGNGIRAKYEVIGNQDGTTGLYLANNRAVSLEWQNNREMNDIYHNIEDTYETFLPRLKQGILDTKVNTFKSIVVYWIIRGPGFALVPCVNVDQMKTAKNIPLKDIIGYKKASLILPYTGETFLLNEAVIPYLEPLHSAIAVFEW